MHKVQFLLGAVNRYSPKYLFPLLVKRVTIDCTAFPLDVDIKLSKYS